MAKYQYDAGTMKLDNGKYQAVVLIRTKNALPGVGYHEHKLGAVVDTEAEAMRIAKAMKIKITGK